MKVYILIGVWDYNGDTILGVYKNKELAEEQKNKEEKQNYGYDDYRIEEHEVLE